MAGAWMGIVVGPSAPESGQPERVAGMLPGDPNDATIWYV